MRDCYAARMVEDSHVGVAAESTIEFPLDIHGVQSARFMVFVLEPVNDWLARCLQWMPS